MSVSMRPHLSCLSGIVFLATIFLVVAVIGLTCFFDATVQGLSRQNWWFYARARVALRRTILSFLGPPAPIEKGGVIPELLPAGASVLRANELSRVDLGAGPGVMGTALHASTRTTRDLT
jgi:hypothetical protein